MYFNLLLLLLLAIATTTIFFGVFCCWGIWLLGGSYQVAGNAFLAKIFTVTETHLSLIQT